MEKKIEDLTLEEAKEALAQYVQQVQQLQAHLETTRRQREQCLNEMAAMEVAIGQLRAQAQQSQEGANN
jgi:hypothetical protein